MTADVGGSLANLERGVAILFTMAATLVGLWVVGRWHRSVPRHTRKQARNLAVIATAVWVTLIMVFLSDASKLPLLGTLTLGLLLAAVALFLWNEWTRMHMRQADPTRAVIYIGTFVGYVSLGGAALAASSQMLTIYTGNPLNREGAVPFDISIALTGRRPPTPGVPQTFRVASPRVGVLCDRTERVTFSWQLPPGAVLDGSPRAHWTNLDAARAVDARHDIQRQRIVATGRLAGPPAQRVRLPFGGSLRNCPGGGAGTLVLSGSYLPRQGAAVPYVSELEGRLFPGRGEAALSVVLPEPDVTITEARITAAQEGRLVDELRLTFSAGVARESVSRNEVFSASTAGRELTIRLYEGGR